MTGLPGTGKSTAADAAGAHLGAAVLAHDWAMSGLRPYPELQRALDTIDFGHRQVGWSILVVTDCRDATVHRSRVEGRRRGIPGWYELDWERVQRARDAWVPVADPDLVLDVGARVPQNLDHLRSLLGPARSN